MHMLSGQARYLLPPGGIIYLQWKHWPERCGKVVELPLHALSRIGGNESNTA